MSFRFQLSSMALMSLLMCACATTKPQSEPVQAAPSASTATAASTASREVKSRDGKYSGEVTGTPVAGSKFSKLVIGMEVSEVQEILGRTPDRSHSYESGKRWIPFYFGNDARRTQALYKGEGCLLFTGGNIWGGGGGDLIGIAHDSSGSCYQP
jgi:hypothetical protein